MRVRGVELGGRARALQQVLERPDRVGLAEAAQLGLAAVVGQPERDALHEHEGPAAASEEQVVRDLVRDDRAGPLRARPVRDDHRLRGEERYLAAAVKSRRRRGQLRDHGRNERDRERLAGPVALAEPLQQHLEAGLRQMLGRLGLRCVQRTPLESEGVALARARLPERGRARLREQRRAQVVDEVADAARAALVVVLGHLDPREHARRVQVHERPLRRRAAALPFHARQRGLTLAEGLGCIRCHERQRGFDVAGVLRGVPALEQIEDPPRGGREGRLR